MAIQTIFQRYEIKYRITRAQQERIVEALRSRMREEVYGDKTVCNVYFDTPSHLLIRRSLEKPVYKEKLRVRSYGRVSPDGTVFLELKKKHKGVVYKRRIALPEEQAMAYLCQEKPVADTQIRREIDYVLSYYGDLQPMMYLCYDRRAFFGIDDPHLRVTFDDNIRWRRDRLRLTEDTDGRALLPDDVVLMEIKTATALPLWLTELLARERIYKSSFSKYGTAYLEEVKEDINNG